MGQDLCIETLLVSPVHRFAGRPGDGPTPYEGVETRQTVQLRAGRGIVGDRYFGHRFRFASVTLLAAESVDRLATELGTGPLDPFLARRNVVTRGVDVDSLARTTFTLDAGHGPIRFISLTPANPCAWMNVVYAPGAHRALRGHAGIRCEPLDDGIFAVGPATLDEVVPLAPDELRRRVESASAR
ncbi:MAG: MOSC domain-containing protein [Jatrophihabitans sp.]